MLPLMSHRPSYVLRNSIAILIWLLLAGCSGEPDADNVQEGDSTASSPAQPNPLSVIFETNKGTFEIRLRPDLAPVSSANFCNLVDRGFYHGLEISGANAVARSLGETPRTPSYQAAQEYSNELLFDRPGIVAWSNLPRASLDDPSNPHPTRFFMTIKPQPEWNLAYVPFGTLESGVDVLGTVQVGDWIRSVRIKGDPTWLMELYADEIESWNQALDTAGYPRAGTAGSARRTPVNSN